MTIEQKDQVRFVKYTLIDDLRKSGQIETVKDIESLLEIIEDQQRQIGNLIDLLNPQQK
jgi:hypothetical protein